MSNESWDEYRMHIVKTLESIDQQINGVKTDVQELKDKNRDQKWKNILFIIILVIMIEGGSEYAKEVLMKLIF